MNMKDSARELNEVVDTFATKFDAISETDFSAKPLANKWSRQEVVGHLIDSAQNNLRRFVTGQYEPTPPKITYNQDFWVKANDYQSMNKSEIIMLWKLINKRIVSVLMTMPEEQYKRQCETNGLHTLEWLAEDYVKHMKHHLNQIIPRSFDIVYVS